MAENPAGQSDDAHPTIDVSGALGEAGHELEDLGAADAVDDAPVVKTTEDLEEDEAREAEREAGLGRGVFGRLPGE